MPSIATNRAKRNLLGHRYRGEAPPATLFLALATATTAPTADTNVLGDLTEIAAGNGYTSGGIALTPGATDFDVITEDDTNDRSFIQVRDVIWTASGGPLPASGLGAAWAVLTGPNATVSAREVDAALDLGGARAVSTGQTLTIQNAEIRIS